jgi:hypothetical protein
MKTWDRQSLKVGESFMMKNRGMFHRQREADKIHIITCFGESMVARTMTRNERQPRSSSLLLPSFYNLNQLLPLYWSIETPDDFVVIPCLLLSTFIFGPSLAAPNASPTSIDAPRYLSTTRDYEASLALPEHWQTKHLAFPTAF